MNRQLDLSDDAELDLADALAWYDKQSFTAGDRLVREIIQSCAQIAEHAERYPKVRGSIRRVAVNRFP